MVDATVIFATYNGSRHLGETLGSFCELDTRNISWELIVVDNNSNDGSSDIVRTFMVKLPLKLLSEPRPGKSRALNSAIQASQGDLVLFTDDDVLVDRDWLKSYLSMAQRQPGFDVFGGRIRPIWEKEPDARLKTWIPLGSTYAVIDDVVDGPCEPGRVWGPNMAVRRKVLRAGHRFREDLGPLPTQPYPMGEDTEFILRLSKSGFKPCRCAGAVVHHFIEPEVVNEQWVVERAERLGFGIPAVHPEQTLGVQLRGVPIRALLSLAAYALGSPLVKRLPRSKARFWFLWRYFYTRGFVRGCYQFSRILPS